MGPPQITAIVAYSKGFACACGPGTVHLFEKTDDKDFFKKAREIKASTSMLYSACSSFNFLNLFKINLSEILILREDLNIKLEVTE